MSELIVENLNTVEMTVEDENNIPLAEDSTTRIIQAVSPTAVTERVTGGAKLTVTDINGTTEAVINDGPQGEAEFVHIKYSEEEPTQDSDMHDTPDAWMGVCTDTSETAPTAYTDYQWYNIKGTKGDPGDPGAGIIPGGSAGQFLKKSSSTDYDTEWDNVPDPQTMTGATATTAGTGGLVPAPGAGANVYFLKGDGTWAVPAGGKLIVKDLDTVTNTSGSYTHSTTISDVTSDMKAVMIELGDPTAFLDTINVTTADGSITLSCDSVAGTSTVKVSLLFIAGSDAITSSEFDVLAARIGTLSSLTTTAKTSTVAAINELDSDISTLNGKIQYDFGTKTTSDFQTALETLLNTYPSGGGQLFLVLITDDLYGDGANARHTGFAIKSNTDRYNVYLQRSGSMLCYMGAKLSTGWTWRRIVRDNEVIFKKESYMYYNMHGFGYVSASTTTLTISFPMDLLFPSSSTVTITSLKGTVRGVKGYVDIFTDGNKTNEIVGTSGYTIGTYTSNGRRTLCISIAKTSAMSNIDNNTPVEAFFGTMVFTIS